ncbi:MULTISPECIES: hypothetical protein [Halorussus]|uniref:hypothetical protein n=1 Tax=Halorussus TaxID=1070314 RepID=UPI000E2108A5|nr:MULTISPECIES: hypothetical protein [Halorussus]NHN57525.1 hypothetical protein [Halorussus sp. JP-T4]
MTELKEEVVAELEEHQETLRLDEFVRLIETYHEPGVPGVDRETIAAYADAAYFDVDESALDDRLTDSDDWESGKRLYEVGDGRISNYPPEWHERLGGTDDVKDIIETLQTDVTEPEGQVQEAVTDEGVPEQKVARVAKIVADLDEQEVRDRIKRLRDDGEIEEFASQGPSPRIQVRERPDG